MLLSLALRTASNAKWAALKIKGFGVEFCPNNRARRRRGRFGYCAAKSSYRDVCCPNVLQISAARQWVSTPFVAGKILSSRRSPPQNFSPSGGENWYQSWCYGRFVRVAVAFLQGNAPF